MHFIYLTTVVCITGVVSAALADSTSTGGNANSIRSPESYDLLKDKKMPEDIKNGFVNVINKLFREAQEKNGANANLPLETEMNGHIDNVYASIKEGMIDANVIDRNHGISRPGLLTWDPYWETTSGIVQVQYEKEGIICSGTHLAPWILLTTAGCVAGRDPEKTYAVVTYTDSNSDTHTDTIGVKDININPNYIKGKIDNDIAVLIIYGHQNWTMDLFSIPATDYTTDVLIDNGLTTYANQWDTKGPVDYEETTVKIYATKNFTLCGSIGNLEQAPWYCVDRSDKTHDYRKIDHGTPFFYVDNDIPYCLGLYTGAELQKSQPGILYQSIYPNVDWINDQIHQNPFPPF